MNISINEELFGDLYPFIIKDTITDIRWNGRALWVEDAVKGRIKTDVKLTDKFLRIFSKKMADKANVNFNKTEPSLQMSTEEFRIHMIHPEHTGDGTYILSIRRTPAVARITNESIIRTGYADEKIRLLLDGLIKSRCSIVVIGDTGAGKTELLKYLAGFIPDDMTTLTVEDRLEMRLSEIYPEKDISSIKVNEQYTYEQAIRDALGSDIKYLWIAECRGREIARVIEGASACTAATTMHERNVVNIPDRIVQMAGKDRNGETFKNDVYRFFDVGIRVKKDITPDGVSRKIDQICFFERTHEKNVTTLYMNEGVCTGQKIPASIRSMFKEYGQSNILNQLETGRG